MTLRLLFLGWVYLAASVPFGLLLSTLWGRGEDVREAGSGNIGTTNVFRTQGRGVALAVLGLDIGKGLFSVLLARWMWPEGGIAWEAAAALTAFTGHCLPVYLAFRGGKGVATGAGAMIALAPGPAAFAVAAWGGLLALTGRSSVASLGAAGVLLVAVVWLRPDVLVAAGLIAAGVGMTHTGNLRRLVEGTEAAVITPIRRGPQLTFDPHELLARGPAGEGTRAPALWAEE